MKFKTKNNKIHIIGMAFVALIIVCLSMIFGINPTVNLELISTKAESSYYDVVTDNWGYFCMLEQEYRSQNPNVTYDEMVTYLESKVSEIEENDDVIIPAGSENISSVYNTLTIAERELLEEDPFGALIVYGASEWSKAKTRDYYEKDNRDDDNSNAFKHAYWNALMVRWLGMERAEAFATAHEYGQNGLSSHMDLLNNEKGRSDGLDYTLNDIDLAFKIMERVSEGYYWQYINRVYQDNVLVAGDLVPTDETDLLPEYATYTITLILYDDMTQEVTVRCGKQIEIEYAPYRRHYEFKGYYSEPNGQGTCYVTTVLGQTFSDYYEIQPRSTNSKWNAPNDGTLYAHWELLKADCEIVVLCMGEGYLNPRTINITSNQTVTLTANTPKGYLFDSWRINGVFYSTENVTYTFELHRSYITGKITIHSLNNSSSAAYGDGSITLYLQKDPNSQNECVAEGTLITLADGRQVPVESLTGNEMLLVWNLHTGQFESAPILFIDHDPAKTYKVVNLYFSDGTHVKVISEHAFFDFNLNEYVFLREDAGQYIGHWFNKQTTDEFGNMTWTRVQLANVVITEEYTTAWSPVTYGHLCIYVNGMLSMPGATTGLINIFEVDGDSMRIDQEQYLADIETYGLFTYEEFAELYPVPEEMFNAVNGQYLKVSIGKGLIDYEGLGNLIESYIDFFA